MNRPPGFRGVAFGAAADGDGRSDTTARRRISRSLGLSDAWAYLHQVHGRRVWRASGPGLQGDGDALFTTTPGLPLAVGTADCLPVVLEAGDGVAERSAYATAPAAPAAPADEEDGAVRGDLHG